MQVPPEVSTTPPWVGILVALAIGAIVRFL